MPPEYIQGLTSLRNETAADDLPISGTIPTWLAGTLLRNGPGQFEVGERNYKHWFDALAMLHRFTVADGRVSYANRMLGSLDYKESTARGEVAMRGFATDPCMTAFRRVMSLFDPNMTDNASVNIVRWDERFIALTESPLAVEFDPVTLKTTAHRDFHDHILSRAATTAHPHTHPTTGAIYNLATRFDIPRSFYRIYCYDPVADERTLLHEIAVPRPAYMHSFGITENYAVLAAYPYTLSVPSLAFGGKSFAENFTYDADGV
ncbi:MAG: carotenoid oxygenase family protein, partial [Chloroflexota bacterium]